MVDEASCCLLIMLSNGLRCKMLSDHFFSQRINPMLLQEIFQTPFSNNNNEKKRKTYLPVACQKHKQVVVQYLNIWFLETTINQKRKEKEKKGNIRNLSFYLSSNSFASFLFQLSNLVHMLSTSPPGHPGLATACICFVSLLPIKLNILFIMVLRRVTPNLSLL